MTISDLLALIPKTDIFASDLPDTLSAPCGALRRDAGQVGDGDVFFCIRGTKFDGHDAIPEAIARGASLLILSDPARAENLTVPWICVRDPAVLFLPACLCAAGHPEHRLRLFAVTGTNGKTSITYLMEAIFAHTDTAFAPCAVIGTVENRIAGQVVPSSQTTPPPEMLCELLCRARDAHVKTVILEASSHALAQNRLSGLHFETAIFTNLTEDHLDYHKNMEEYFQCKRKLFFQCDTAILNTDDPFGKRLFEDNSLPRTVRRISYSLSDAAADVYADDQNTANAVRLHIRTKAFGEGTLQSRLYGGFAAANITAAAAACLCAGISFDEIQAGLSALPCIPGRMERIVSDTFSVYLDYAHTPDALARAIRCIRTFAVQSGGRVLVLFGCGGDREHEKRPKMGRIASALADVCVITSDNSRSEDPAAVIADITSGIPENPDASENAALLYVIPDRKTAIETILSLAKPHDVILLAGKGHEAYQCDKTGCHPFSERDIVFSYLKQHTHSI